MAEEFVMRRRVQFSEVDRAGVLYFAHYYRFMEETEHAFWRSIGVSVVSEIDGREISWPRAATSCEYFAPVRFEDELELALKVVKVGVRSVGYEVEFRRDGHRVAVGRMAVVSCTSDAGEFKPVDVDLASALPLVILDGVTLLTAILGKDVMQPVEQVKLAQQLVFEGFLTQSEPPA